MTEFAFESPPPGAEADDGEYSVDDPFAPDFADNLDRRFSEAEDRLTRMLEPFTGTPAAPAAAVPTGLLDEIAMQQTEHRMLLDGEAFAHEMIRELGDEHDHLKDVNADEVMSLARGIAHEVFAVMPITDEAMQAVMLHAAEQVAAVADGRRIVDDEFRLLNLHYGNSQVNIKDAHAAARELFEESDGSQEAARRAIREGFDAVNERAALPSRQQRVLYYSHQAKQLRERGVKSDLAQRQERLDATKPLTSAERVAKYARMATDNKIAAGLALPDRDASGRFA